MSGGAPTKYREEFADQALKLCLLGYTDVDLAAFFEVCEKTINNWKHDFPEFLQSIKNGKERSDTEIEMSLREKAMGGDTTAQIFWLKNRQPKRWRDRQEIEQTNHHNYVIADEPMSEEDFSKQHDIDSMETSSGSAESSS